MLLMEDPLRRLAAEKRMSTVLPRYCCTIGVESSSLPKASLRMAANTFTW
jgi:hypothetical protein